MSRNAPERALEQARERATAARARGEYADAHRFAKLGEVEDDGLLKLHEWAFLEVDPEQIYSTRRLGAPITFLKRGLLRLLRQYNGEVLAQQTRFNLHLVGELARLEARASRLEEPATEESERH